MVLQNTKKKTTFGLGYKFLLTRKIDNAVLNEDNAINNAKAKINAIEWYVPPYTPGISNQAVLSKHFLSKTLTEFQYVERFETSKFTKFLVFWIGDSRRH